jgi:hypothetical protein
VIIEVEREGIRKSTIGGTQALLIRFDIGRRHSPGIGERLATSTRAARSKPTNISSYFNRQPGVVA